MTAPNPEGDVVLVPREPTEAMIEAAYEAHYGKRRVRNTGGARGISMAVNGADFDGYTAFRRMWKGALSAAPAALQPRPVAPDGVREADVLVRPWAVALAAQVIRAFAPDERLLLEALDAVPTYRQCKYCGPGIVTGLPGNACENCMGTGLAEPELETAAWAWVQARYPNDAASDLAFDAEEMVDAYIAGASARQQAAPGRERGE